MRSLSQSPSQPASVPSAEERLTLVSDQLAVEVLPGKGADIYALVDRASGIDVLFKTPWGWRENSSVAAATDSWQRWLGRYPGGWQQLVPNAGAAVVVDGVERGFHGEAALVPWTVEQVNDHQAELSTELLSAPLRLTRSLSVAGPVLRVVDQIANLAPVPVTVSWVQHPAFGAPFLDPCCRIDTGARQVRTDAAAAGDGLPLDAVLPVPRARAEDGTLRDLGTVPAPDSATSRFAALIDFDQGWAAISNPRLGFGIAMAWDATVLPYAWYWQECGGTGGYPWFGRAYVAAIEPANALPGAGIDPGRDMPPRIAAGQGWTSIITVSRFVVEPGLRVSGVTPDGTVSLEPVERSRHG